MEALELSAEARRRVEDQLTELAELLPIPDVWATLGQGDESTLALLAGDLLLTIGRGTATDEEGPLVVRCNPLRVTEVCFERKDQNTLWDFQFRDRDPLRVEGRMDYPGAPGPLRLRPARGVRADARFKHRVADRRAGIGPPPRARGG